MDNEKPSDKVNILQFISQTHRQEFDRRRTYEWRVLFSTLSLYVLSIAGSLSGRLNLNKIQHIEFFVWASFSAISIISIWYLFHIHSAHGINKKIAEIAEKSLIMRSGEQELIDALNAIPVEASSSVSPNESVIKNNWSWFWQVVTILSVSVIASVVVINAAT